MKDSTRVEFVVFARWHYTVLDWRRFSSLFPVLLCRKEKRTKVLSYIQTDLGGMLPKALVENALPSNQIDFFTSLRKALQDAGQWHCD